MGSALNTTKTNRIRGWKLPRTSVNSSCLDNLKAAQVFRYHLEESGGEELDQILRIIRYEGWRILSKLT